MNTAKRIGLRIRTMRQSRKMTQADLAYAINQSPSSITMYETGRRCPNFETLEALADIFNVPLASIVTDDERHEMNLQLFGEYHTQDPQIRLVVDLMETMTDEQKQQVVAIVRAFANTSRPVKKG